MNSFTKKATMKTAIVFSLLFLFFASVSFAAINVLPHTSVVIPTINFTISGNISSAGDDAAGLAVSASLPDSVFNGTNVTDSRGAFSVIVTAPSTSRESNVTLRVVYSNGSSESRNLPARVSSVNTVEIFFIGAQPPFNASTTFQARILLKNSSNEPLASYSPTVQVFAENSGSASDWTLANQSATTNASGEIIYNITSPSSAAGKYALIVERGKGMRGLMISSGVSLSVNILDSSGSQATDYAPGETVTIQAKLTNTTGSITGASPVAYLTLPNSTVVTKALPANPDSENYSGYYNASYVIPSGVSGTIEIQVVATINSRTEESRAIINVKSFVVEVSDQEDFFKDFGGKRGLPPGGQVGLDVFAINISTDSDITGSLDGTTADSLNCSNISLVRLWNVVNGTNYSATLTKTAGMDMMQTVCKISFTAPNAAATYGIIVNVSYKGGSETGTGYFAAQNYFLSVSPQISTGGEMEFMPMALPNANITFQVSAWNLSSNTAVPKALIQSIMATKITPLMFMGGGSAANTSPSYWATGSGSTSPHVNVTTLSLTGPQLIEVNSSIGGEQVTGSGFVMTKYIMGFLMPASSTGGMGGGGTSCSGNMTFMGMVKDIRTNQLATGASITDISEARNEMTGQNIRSCLNLTPATTTSGQANVTLSVNSSCSLSGFYFMLINTTYQGMSDFIPSGFSCKTLDFWPEVTTSQGFGWRVAPQSCVNISVNRITKLSTRANVTSGNISITRVGNMVPGKGGGKMLQNTVPLFTALTSPGGGASGIGTIMLCPQNFTLGGQALSAWPNGFMDITVQACDASSNSCDTSWSGMRITPFDMWIERMGWSNTFSIGSNQSVVINVKANVSPANASAFTVTVGRPWEGSMLQAEVAAATLLNDGWNSSDDNNRWDGRERWNVTYTIPIAVKKGGAQITFEVNGSTTYGLNETATDDMWGTLQKYVVLIPSDESPDDFRFLRPADSVQDNNTLLANGINLTVLQNTYKLSSRSGMYILSNANFTLQRNGDQGQSTIYYGNQTALVVFDNLTAGVCDTVVLKQGNNVKILSVNSSFGARSVHAGLRLKDIPNCFMPTFVNSTAAITSYQQYGSASNWGGSHEYNREFTIPYVIVLNGQPIDDKTVSINSVIQQRSEGSGNKGVGMEGSLTSSNYSSTSDTTSTDGIAFVKLKVNVSGRVMAFWKLENATEVEDIAAMESGTAFKILQFSTSGGSIYAKPVVSRATLVLSESGGFNMMNGAVWNGTLAETTDTDFMANGLTSTYYIAVNSTNGLRMAFTPYWGGEENARRLAGINTTLGPGAACNAPNSCVLGIADSVGLVTSNITSAGASTYAIIKTAANPGSADVTLRLNLSSDGGTTYFLTDAINVANADPIGTQYILANTSSAIRVFAGLSGDVPVLTSPLARFDPSGPFLELWTTGALKLDCEGNECYLNQTITTQVEQFAVNAFTGNSTHKTIAFVQTSPSPGAPLVQNATENVSVFVCANTFDQPTARPIEGLNVNLTLQYFSQGGGMGGSEQNAQLTMYSPITDAATTNITTGPGGCAALKVGPPEGGWQNCGVMQTIMAAVTNGTHSEGDIWVTQVNRQCNWGGGP